MTDREFEKLIEKTLAEHGTEYFTLPDAPPHEFSPDFDNRIKALAAGKKKKGPKLLRIIAPLAAAAAVLAVCVAVSGALQSGFSGTGMVNKSDFVISQNAATERLQEDSSSKPDSSSVQGNYGDAANEAAATDEYNDTDKAEEPAYNNVKNISADSPVPENNNGSEAPLAEAGAAYSVTADILGQRVVFASEKAAEVFSKVQKLVSDSDLAVDTAFTEEGVDSFRKNGCVVTVTAENGENLSFNGKETPYTAVTLLLDDTSGFAIAEGKNAYECFAVTEYSEMYKFFTDMI